jgi:hypothetical protein
MADQINISAAEYNKIFTNLEKIHETYDTAFTSITNQLKEINTKDGGLQVDGVSKELGLLIGKIIMTNRTLKTTMTENKATIGKFATKVKDNDKV